MKNDLGMTYALLTCADWRVRYKSRRDPSKQRRFCGDYVQQQAMRVSSDVGTASRGMIRHSSHAVKRQHRGGYICRKEYKAEKQHEHTASVSSQAAKVTVDAMHATQEVQIAWLMQRT